MMCRLLILRRGRMVGRSSNAERSKCGELFVKAFKASVIASTAFSVRIAV